MLKTKHKKRTRLLDKAHNINASKQLMANKSDQKSQPTFDIVSAGLH